MLNKIKQMFLKMGSFVVLISFQIWAYPNRPTDILMIGALAALACCAMIIALAYRWDEPDYLDWSIAGYVTFIAAFLFFWPEPAKSFLHHYAGIAIFGSFFAAAFFPPLFGFAPFTVHSAKKKTPEAFWKYPVFMEINKILTFVWAGIFAICMMLSYSPSIMLNLIVPNILMMGFGLPFSSFFPAYYMRRKGITFRPSSIEEFMAIMPMGFNPKGAKGVNAVIQFDFAGAQQMFMEKKFQVSGDMSLLMKMGELFKKRN